MVGSVSTVGQIGFPPRGGEPSRSETAELLAVLRGWLATMTDRLFAVDAQQQTIGPDAPASLQADIAAAFVAHQAIGARLEAMSGSSGGAQLVEWCYVTVAAPDSTVVAANLNDACVLLEAVIGKAESELSRTATHVHETLRVRGAINADLDVAGHLAQLLGDQVRHVNALSVRATKAMTELGTRIVDVDSPEFAALARLSADIAAVRAALEAADDERQQLLVRWEALPARLAELQRRESDVRAQRDECEAKIRPVPRLAIPDVDVLAVPLSVDDIERQPWPAVQATARGYVQQLDRVGAALDEASRRFTAPLREREELRGLLRAFNDKAGEAGLAEHPDLTEIYRAAADVLWSAPCDLLDARQRVYGYLAAVNAITNGETPRPVDHSGGRP